MECVVCYEQCFKFGLCRDLRHNICKDCKFKMVCEQQTFECPICRYKVTDLKYLFDKHRQRLEFDQCCDQYKEFGQFSNLHDGELEEHRWDDEIYNDIDILTIKSG